MCRHVAYVGPAMSLGALIVDPPFALYEQAESPRHQHDGTRNVDGFGVALYDAARTPPYLHRNPVSITEDPALAEISSRVATGMLAAIRNASEGIELGERNTAPYTSGRWAFSHNGFVRGFVSSTGGSRPRERLTDLLTPRRRDRIEGTTDSEVLFALCLDAIDAGADPADALVRTVRTAIDLSGEETSRLNLLLTDGSAIHATRWRNSLFMLSRGAGDTASVVVASEPFDDDSRWTEVPDGSVLVATPASIMIGGIS